MLSTDTQRPEAIPWQFPWLNAGMTKPTVKTSVPTEKSSTLRGTIPKRSKNMQYDKDSSQWTGSIFVAIQHDGSCSLMASIVDSLNDRGT